MKYRYYYHTIIVFLSVIVALAVGAPVWAQAERGLFVPDDLLPAELQGMAVKDFYVPAGGEEVGKISMVGGHLVVLHKDTGEAFFAQEGDGIFEQDLFFTLQDSKCRLNFNNADVISMAADTKISIDEMVDDRDKKEKKSLVSMLRGKAMFYVVKLFKYRKTSATVNTPTAVCGVRGTKFVITISKETKKSAQGIPVYLADLSRPAETASDLPVLYLAQAETGTVTTVVDVLEGVVVLTLPNGDTLTLHRGETGWVDSDGNSWSGPTEGDLQEGDVFTKDDPGDGEDDPEKDAEDNQGVKTNVETQLTTPTTW